MARGIEKKKILKELGYSGAEVAGYLCITASCVTKVVSSGKEPEKKHYI